MELTYEEFKVLFGIMFWHEVTPKAISKVMEIPIEEVEGILKKFIENELIEISKREEDVYIEKVSEKAEKIFKDDKYSELRLKLNF